MQLKTVLRDERSQKAIENISASDEGLLSNRMILADGYYRHLAFYSILDTAWEEVKRRLVEMPER